ncbi:MAG: hypothetical protein V4664_03805 [Patescibacteria group bacterium]
MIKKYFLQQIFGIVILVGFFTATCVSAADLTSTSFIVRDPLVGTGGSYGSSASFSAFGSGDMTNIGRSTSASFEGREGFLWFPYVIQGVFSAVANGSNADLTWGASTAGLGWDVSGYNTGIKPTGGSYTYTARGLVTSYTYTGLTPGGYCFKLQTLDAFSNIIATSSEECITIQPVITFSISDNSIGFGALSASATRYATGDLAGFATEPTPPAHIIIAATNAPNGYVVTIQGLTLTSGLNTVSSISGGPTGLSIGSEQFGIRTTATGGSGAVTSPYNGSAGNYGYSTTPSTPTNFASASGVTTATTYNVNYAANISTITDSGEYGTTLTYIISGTF